MKKHPRQFDLEQLEDRLTPAGFGALWSDPTHLTLSFAPDGTDISGGTSNLFSTVPTSASQSAWQQDILRAFQTWAVNSNINIGVVGDDGSAFGTPGAVQGDMRFGDIRVGAMPMAGASVATTSFVVPGSTWSGDVIINSNYAFGSGTGQYDLFTVALHEAGHVFALQDSSDANSVMYTQYRGAYTGLMADDVALIKSVYGARTPSSGNNATLQSATYLNLSSSASTGSPTTVSGDVSNNQDVHFYRFHTNGNFNPAEGVDITLHASGLSLLEGKLTVLDGKGNVLAVGTAADPLHNDVVIHLSQAQGNSDFYIQVQGATSDVFGIGAYQLTVDPNPQSSVASSNFNRWAQQLSASSATSPLVGYGSISAASGSSIYRFQTGNTVSPAGANVVLKAWGLGITSPTVTIYNAAGTVVGRGTVTDGFLSIHLDGLSANSSYYVGVQSGTRTAFGLADFVVQVDLRPDLNAPVTAASTLLVTAPSQWNSINLATGVQKSIGTSQQTTNVAVGSLTGPTDSDFYRVRTLMVGNGGTSVLTVSLLAENAQSLSPVATVYDQFGNVVAATVQTNSSGVFIISVANAASNANYYIQVRAGAGSGSGVGNYFLRIDNSTQQSILQQTVAQGTLNQGAAENWGTFNSTANQLVNFVLSASSGQSAAGEGVKLSCYDASGKLVFSITAYAGQPSVTQMAYLTAGTYIFHFESIVASGAALAPESFSLGIQTLSQPIDPVPLNPTMSTTSSPSSSTTSGTTTSPISSPSTTPTTTTVTSTTTTPTTTYPTATSTIPPSYPTTSTSPTTTLADPSQLVAPPPPLASTYVLAPPPPPPSPSSPTWTYSSTGTMPPYSYPITP